VEKNYTAIQVLEGNMAHYCIRCGPGQERILDSVPGGTELGTQVKTGSRAGRTHTLNNPQVEYTGVLLCLTRE
jgi:hypothetical protein